MRGLTEGSFGVVIAYLVPGLVALTAMADFLPGTESWLGLHESGPTVGGFLYGTLGAIGAGLTISAIRWLTLDHIHHTTGLPTPSWDFSRLTQHYGAFQGAVENHYRYYQHYGNMLVAVLLIPLAPSAHARWLSDAAGWIVGCILIPVYFLASRDALSKYYARTAAMLVLTPGPKETSNDQRLAPSEGKDSTCQDADQAGS